jgi:hypothetical protein
MEQSYLIVNVAREEYLSPEDLGCGAKLWEICANDLPRVLPYLLQQSSELGEGDPQDQEVTHLGRWAGDSITVVGASDSSGLYQTAESEYTEISDEIRPEVNEFLPFRYRLDSSIYGWHGPEYHLGE